MNNRNFHLILVRGASGSGKSTVAMLFENRETYLISTDDMFVSQGFYRFDASKLGEYHQATIDKVKQQMLHTETAEQFEPFKTTIVVHNTFTEAWEMKPYIDLAEEFDWTVHTMIVENRHKSESVHKVPSQTIEQQKEKLSENIVL